MIYFLLSASVLSVTYWSSSKGIQRVPTGFRLPDIRDSLEEKRTSHRPKFSLTGDPRLDAYRSILAAQQDNVKKVSGSPLQEVIRSSVIAFSNACYMHFLWPENLFRNICWFFVFSPMSVVHIWMGLDLAYTDTRDAAIRNLLDSIIAFVVYLGTLLTPRLTLICWHLVLHLIHFTWANLASISTSGVIVCALLYVVKVPPSWVSSNVEFMGWLQFRATTSFINVGFMTVSKTVALWRHVRSAIRMVTNILWKMTAWVFGKFGRQWRREFCYLALPQVEKLRRRECLNLKKGLEETREDDDAPKIRLLLLRRKWPLLELRADLITCDLEDAPSYHAISYVWKHGPQNMRSIILNNMSFYVRGNVHDILRRCSSYFGPRLIWIDSICIDQNFPEEKSLQVRKMKDIYKNASDVLVCLGDPPGATLAMSLLWELNFVMKKFGKKGLIKYVAGFHERRGFDKFLCARIETVLDLLQNPWFERIWVIQEVVVAKDVHVFYGNHSMTWSSFREYWQPFGVGPVNGVLTTFHAPREPTILYSSPFSSLPKTCFLAGFRMEFGFSGPKPLGHVLRLFISWKATEKIDKIFAIIGLVDGDVDVSFLKGLVDYKRPKKEIILELASHAVETGSALENLDLAGIGWGGRDLTLPTWVVDWCAMTGEVPLSRPLTPGNEYKAAADKPSKVVKGDNDMEIVVRGQFADRIKILALDLKISTGKNPLHFVRFMSRHLDEIDALARASVPDPYVHMENKDCAQSQDEAPSRKQPLEEAIWRTLIGDRTFRERPAAQSYGKVIASQIRMLQFIEPHITGVNPETFFHMRPSEEVKKRLGTLADQEEMKKSNEAFQEVDFLFDNPASKRVFCVTEKGYIGMVPHLSRVGDVVCVFFGAKVPFVVRCAGLGKAGAGGGGGGEEGEGGEVKEGGAGEGGVGKYQLVGEAYIHGMMDGQALEMGHTEVDFTLF